MPASYYSSEFPSGVQPGDYVLLDYSTKSRQEVVQVRRRDPQPGLESQEFEVSANSTLENQRVEAIEQDSDVLAQLRMPRLASELPEGVEIRVDYGGQNAPYYAANNARGKLTNETGTVTGYNPSGGSVYTGEDVLTVLTEFWLYGGGSDDKLYFTFENTTTGDETFSLTFAGWQYVVRDVNINTPDPADSSVEVVPVGRTP